MAIQVADDAKHAPTKKRAMGEGGQAVQPPAAGMAGVNCCRNDRYAAFLCVLDSDDSCLISGILNQVKETVLLDSLPQVSLWAHMVAWLFLLFLFT